MSSPLLGPDGRPIVEQDPTSAVLSVGIQALIEAKVNSAMDVARETLTRENRERRRASLAKLIALAVVNLLGALVLWYVGPDYVRQWTREYVQEFLTKPMLRQAADEAIRTKMSEFVDSQLQPVRDDTRRLADLVDETKNQISSQQARLQTEQTLIGRRLLVQQLALGAKAGSLSDWKTLAEMGNGDADMTVRSSASVARHEIELYFDADRGQISYHTLVDALSKKSPGYSLEELACIYQLSPTLRESAVNTMATLNRPEAVGLLCKGARSETDLRVLARTTWAINGFSGQDIQPLDLDRLAYWCGQNADQPRYTVNYDAFISLCAAENAGSLNLMTRNTVLSILNETVAADPKALAARSWRGGLMALNGDFAAAESDFAAVGEIDNGFVWLSFWRAAMALKRQQFEQAIASFKDALAKAPASVTALAGQYPIFEPLVAVGEIPWPEDHLRPNMCLRSPPPHEGMP